MVLKVGLLVLCQFYWAGTNLKVEGDQAPPAPQEMVGTIKGIYPQKAFKTITKNGKVFAMADEKTLIEIQGQKPENTYFISAASCVPVRKQEDIEAEVQKDESMKAAWKAKSDQLKKEVEGSESVDLVITKAKELDFKHGTVSKALDKIAPTPLVVEEDKKPVAPEVKRSEPAPVVTLAPSTPEVNRVEPAPAAPPAVPEVKVVEKAPEVNRVEPAPVAPPAVPEVKIAEKSPEPKAKSEDNLSPKKEDKKNSEDSIVKGMIKDIFNQ